MGCESMEDSIMTIKTLKNSKQNVASFVPDHSTSITSTNYTIYSIYRTLQALEYSPSHGASARSSFNSVSSSSVCPASSFAFN
jgi:hypothetical protein